MGQLTVAETSLQVMQQPVKVSTVFGTLVSLFDALQPYQRLFLQEMVDYDEQANQPVLLTVAAHAAMLPLHVCEPCVRKGLGLPTFYLQLLQRHGTVLAVVIYGWLGFSKCCHTALPSSSQRAGSTPLVACFGCVGAQLRAWKRPPCQMASHGLTQGFPMHFRSK